LTVEYSAQLTVLGSGFLKLTLKVCAFTKRGCRQLFFQCIDHLLEVI
jgi:hypothetical protein